MTYIRVGHLYLIKGVIITSVKTMINGQLFNVGGIIIAQRGQQIQVAVIPEAGQVYLNKIFQYVGLTNASYINGHFYKCVSDGASTPTYSWIPVDIDPDPDIMDESELDDMWGSTTPSTEIILRSDWNAMTTAEKRSKGLVIIQDSTTGFERGIYVNGADYIPANINIPYSDDSTVLCAADASNFSSLSNTWGYGKSPAEYMDASKRPTYDSTENAVAVFSLSNGVTPYVSKGSKSSPFTAYAVMKLTGTFDRYSRLICSVSSANLNCAILMNGDPIWISAWSNDTQTTYSASTDYAVLCIRFTESGDAAGYIYDTTNDTIYKVSKPTTETDTVITLCRSHITSASEPRDSDAYVRFFGVTDVGETDEVIENNMRHLYQTFVSSQ